MIFFFVWKGEKKGYCQEVDRVGQRIGNMEFLFLAKLIGKLIPTHDFFREMFNKIIFDQIKKKAN